MIESQYDFSMIKCFYKQLRIVIEDSDHGKPKRNSCHSNFIVIVGYMYPVTFSDGVEEGLYPYEERIFAIGIVIMPIGITVLEV